MANKPSTICMHYSAHALFCAKGMHCSDLILAVINHVNFRSPTSC